MSKTSKKLIYALKDDKLVFIDDVENGDKCGCVCPGCKKPLTAKNNESNIIMHHFAHKSAAECSYGYQYSIHILAKEIIEEEKKVVLPGPGKIKGQYESYVLSYLGNDKEYLKSEIYNCSKVILEKKISDYIPDIEIFFGNKPCLIEIAVTHFVDEEKREKIKEAGIPLVEYDLSKLDRRITKGVLKSILLDPLAQIDRYWIFNEKTDELYARAEIKKEEARIELEAERKKLEEQIKKKEEERKNKRIRAEEKAKKYSSPEEYRKAVINLRNDEDFYSKIKSFHFYKDLANNEYPFFIDIPIDGEMVFACDRRLWQSALFDKFVYNRKANSEIIFESINSWIVKIPEAKNLGVILDWELMYSTETKLTSGGSILYAVVNKYLEYLGFLGFIFFAGGGGAVECRHTIEPPLKVNAAFLKAVISGLDPYAPGADKAILDAVKKAKNRR